MKHDIVADALSIISNAEQSGKGMCNIPYSRIVENIVHVMNKSGFIGAYEKKDDVLHIKLIGMINNTKVIKPRFSVKHADIEKWETRYLPAKGSGILVITTPKGVMSHEDAKKKNLGGKLICFVY